jgi:hypothetical protein
VTRRCFPETRVHRELLQQRGGAVSARSLWKLLHGVPDLTGLARGVRGREGSAAFPNPVLVQLSGSHFCFASVFPYHNRPLSTVSHNKVEVCVTVNKFILTVKF